MNMINHDVRPELGVVVTSWQGEVTDEVFVQSYRDLYSAPEWRPGFHELIDLRAGEMTALSTAALHRVLGIVAAALGDWQGSFKTAVIVRRDVEFGLVRVYSALAEDSPEEVGVFRDPLEAQRWLGIEGDLLGAG